MWLFWTVYPDGGLYGEVVVVRRRQTHRRRRFVVPLWRQWHGRGFGMLVTRFGSRRKSGAGVVTAQHSLDEQLGLTDEHNEILIDPSTFRFDEEEWTPWQVNGGSPDDRQHLLPRPSAPMRAGVDPVEAGARVLPDC